MLKQDISLEKLLLVLNGFLLGFLIITILTDDVRAWILWSLLGDEKFYLTAGIILFYLMERSTGVNVAVAVLLSGSLNIFLKYAFNLPRPPQELWRGEASGPGFPSGHSQVSTSFWSSIVFQKKTMGLTISSLIIVTGVSLSRIYLGVHYPLDVAGGVIFGLACGILPALNSPSKASRYRLVTLTVASALNIVNLMRGSEVLASQALLGLSLSLAFNHKRIDSVETLLRGFRTRDRVFIGVSTAVVAMIVYSLSSSIPYGVLTGFFLLGFVMVSAPKIYSIITKKWQGRSC
ncbi:MAG: phosphatase PAP2 family protein [Thermosphaera sp.]